MQISNGRVRTVIAVLAALAPTRLRGLLHRRLLGYVIDPTARIGRCLIDVDEFRAGPGAVVSSLSIIRGCERVEIGDDAIFGSLNWVNGIRRSKGTVAEDRRDPVFVMRASSSVTSMHFIDCCDRVEIGSFALVAGLQSQFLTHSFDHRTGRQAVGPITIGDHAILGTRVLLLPGVSVGARSIVAGGSVLPPGEYEDQSLFAGVPARRKSAVDPEAKIFARKETAFT